MIISTVIGMRPDDCRCDRAHPYDYGRASTPSHNSLFAHESPIRSCQEDSKYIYIYTHMSDRDSVMDHQIALPDHMFTYMYM